MTWKIAETYGDEKMPLLAGSAGLRSNAAYTAHPGGGVIYLEIAKALTLDGMLRADGNRLFCTYASGSSGGSVCVRARKLYGNGSIFACGGDARHMNLAPGGGGRVAVWCCDNCSTLADNIKVDPGYFDAKQYPTPETTAEPGTIYWGDLPCPGTAILLR